jgi:hypothetical protein
VEKAVPFPSDRPSILALFRFAALNPACGGIDHATRRWDLARPIGDDDKAGQLKQPPSWAGSAAADAVEIRNVAVVPLPLLGRADEVIE